MNRTAILAARAPNRPPAPVETTLLELVQVLGELTDDDREVVAAVRDLLAERRVRLTGNFAGENLAVA
ncbi:MAG: hypothetical protein CL910_00620 [Deltaproteobacteria bacterium]|jgi:hypothetical protein|nr:hypothetical protein [Deltaproteobacteria bacterium]